MQVKTSGSSFSRAAPRSLVEWFRDGSASMSTHLHNQRTYIASPQQGGLRLSGPPSGQRAGGGARNRDRRVPADLRSDSLATVPPRFLVHKEQTT
ncbi:tripartite motif-containing protein 2-like [Plakobranchus ocellatus]|uniref:Tripartite motif-containing protein 2-like n=1 Tax=Plakobranchus ocellatus TaxID=259542 RepID=A0AAV4BSE2_9GAST|nr:tripartite motif-containing protein 2-like [Plakobranchus ocellatus]